VNREADRAHVPSRAQRGMAISAAVAVGSATCAVLSGITTAVSTLIFTSLGYDRWTSGDAPAALDVAGFLTFLLILAVAIHAGRATHRATLKLLTQDDGSDS
jgi:hypothetical protein